MSNLSPKDIQGRPAFEQPQVAHVGIEQQRALLEPTQRVRGSVKSTRHGECVCVAVVVEGPPIGASQHFRSSVEVDAVDRRRHTSHLLAEGFQTVEVHHDASALRVDMYIGRRDVRPGHFLDEVVLDVAEIGTPGTQPRSRRVDLRWCRIGRLGGEPGLFDFQTTGRVDLPRAPQVIRIGESDVAAFMVCEVQVVATERFRHPIRYLDERWTLNIGADTRMSGCRDDRRVEQSFYPHNPLSGCRHVHSQNNPNQHTKSGHDSRPSSGIIDRLRFV